MWFILSLLLSFGLNAAIIKNDVSGLKRKVFALKEACEQYGFKHLLLVEAESPTTVDCMGRKLNVQDFCVKHHNEPNLLRGFVSASKSQVYCEYGSAVSLSLSCDQDHYQYCQNDKKGCLELMPIFARNLELMHSSLIGKPINLNCHYSVSDSLGL